MPGWSGCRQCAGRGSGLPDEQMKRSARPVTETIQLVRQSPPGQRDRRTAQALRSEGLASTLFRATIAPPVWDSGGG